MTKNTQNPTKNLTILIATGASGGHMFPALSIAQELKKDGINTPFVVGGSKFNHLVEEAGFSIYHLPASALNVKSIFRKIKGMINLVRAFWRALRLVQEHQPAAIFGTGGYATVALVLAGKISGVPTIIHEQNVLPGRANKFLARWVDTILLTFPETLEYFPGAQDKCQVTGYPLRPEVAAAIEKPAQRADKPLRLLVLGGSQGSRILSHVIPEAIARLDRKLRENLFIQHQARTEDADAVTEAYQQQKLAGFEVTPFVEDMITAITAAHIFVGRSGTGTVVEMSVFGRACVYVPLSLADGHQAKNARLPERAGAAVVLDEPIFTPEALAMHLKHLLTDADARQGMEVAARTFIKTDGAQKAATAVKRAAETDIMQQ